MDKALARQITVSLWLVYCVGSLMWFLHLPKSGGCDGGLCILGPFMLVCSWGAVGVGLLVVYNLMTSATFRRGFPVLLLLALLYWLLTGVF
ncbi:hypothetical protein [Hymenobacter terrenus]|uniref:hypothetical protein n=1 Tax=Hymenobacter terrenus TaxID=1629124 RepID=UPI000619E97D|nr:hypothetical protein [Hymenobacter terrenus]